MSHSNHEWNRKDDTLILTRAGQWSYAEIGRTLGGGLNKNHIRGRHLRLLGWLEERRGQLPTGKIALIEPFLDMIHNSQENPQTTDSPSVSVDATEDAKTVTVKDVKADTQEDAIEQAVQQAGIDQEVWTIARMKATRYEGFYRSRSYQADSKKKNDWRREAKKVTLWSIQLWLERKVITVKDDMATWGRVVIAQMKEHSPHVARRQRPVYNVQKMMAVISMPDLHAGKLAWKPEAGDNYDAKEAQAVFMDAMDYCLNELRGKPITQIVLPLGSDFFHTDNPEGETTAGTSQDTDSRWQKVFLNMKATVIEGIRQCSLVAPVVVKIVPGNHDYNTCFFFGDTLASWFHNDANVSVDNSPLPRKYHQFGVNLIGWTHGDQEKSIDLPMTMALEVPEMWASAKHREIHTGHFHKSARRELSGRQAHIFQTASGDAVDFPSEQGFVEDTINSVVWRSLPALTATDSWHAKRGYIKGPRAAQCYMYDEKNGYTGHINYAYWGQKGS